MLNIYYGDMPEAIYNTSLYFNNTYMDSWITDEMTRKILKSVDKAEVLSPGAVDSKALGVIPVTSISGGSKTLILMYHQPEKVFNASTCGDNCARWILKIADRLQKEAGLDLTVNLHHIMDFGSGSFEIRILNNGAIVHSMAEMVRYVGYYV